MALGDSGPAPYAPAKAIGVVIDYTRDRGVPGGAITPDTLKRIGIEESLVRRTHVALKQLDLIDDNGAPSETLEKIRVAPSSDLEAVLADWLRDAYRPVFQYAEPTEPVERFQDLFRHYEPAGMRNRMVTLFLGLCAKAGLIAAKPPIPRKRAVAQKPKATAPRKSAKFVAEERVQAERKNGRSGETLDDARSRYVDMLMEKAAAQDDPDQALLDRIERALGIAEVSS